MSEVAKTATYTRAYAESNGFLTLLSDGERLTGAYALGPEAGEWLQQATLAIRARVPLDVLRDTIQPFPTFSEIYLAALKALHRRSPPARRQIGGDHRCAAASSSLQVAVIAESCSRTCSAPGRSRALALEQRPEGRDVGLRAVRRDRRPGLGGLGLRPRLVRLRLRLLGLAAGVRGCLLGRLRILLGLRCGLLRRLEVLLGGGEVLLVTPSCSENSLYSAVAPITAAPVPTPLSASACNSSTSCFAASKDGFTSKGGGAASCCCVLSSS